MALGPYNGFTGAQRQDVLNRSKRARETGYWPHIAECEVCGQREGRLGGHNEDYGNPHTHIPLCVVCHLLVHMRFTMGPGLWDEYRRRVRDGWRAPAQTQQSAMGWLKRTILAGRWPEGEWLPLNAVESTFLDLLPMERQTDATDLGYTVRTRGPIPPLPTMSELRHPSMLADIIA